MCDTSLHLLRITLGGSQTPTGLMGPVLSHRDEKADNLHMAVEASRQQEDIGNLLLLHLFLRYPSCLLRLLQLNLVVQAGISMELVVHTLKKSKSHNKS